MCLFVPFLHSTYFIFLPPFLVPNTFVDFALFYLFLFFHSSLSFLLAFHSLQPLTLYSVPLLLYRLPPLPPPLIHPLPPLSHCPSPPLELGAARPAPLWLCHPPCWHEQGRPDAGGGAVCRQAHPGPRLYCNAGLGGQSSGPHGHNQGNTGEERYHFWMAGCCTILSPVYM